MGTALAEWAVQEAVDTRLTGDVTLMALITGIYDDVTAGTAFPYVEYGEPTERPWNTFSKDGREVFVTVNVWSQYQGKKQAVAIASRIVVLLDKYALSVTGWTTVECRLDPTAPIRFNPQPDGRTTQGILRFRIRVQAA